MAKRNVSCAFCIVLVAAAACSAWSQGAPIGPSLPPQGFYQAPQSTPPLAPAQGQAGWTPPAPAYPPQHEIPGPQADRAYPAYPYPAHHNPYYGESSHPNFLSQWMDYVVGLPAAVVGRVADFVDRRVFPASPATQGPQSSAPATQAAEPAPPQAPLPPASAYDQPKP